MSAKGNRTALCPVLKAAVDAPAQIALSDGRHTITYGDLDRIIEATATRLSASGVIPGDLLAVLAQNSMPYAALFYTAFRHGYRLLPLNCRLHSSDWRIQLAECRCRLLLLDHDFTLPAGDLGIETVNIHDVVRPPDHSCRPARPDPVSLDREGVIMYTSGSSGRPRGVVLTWANLHFSALGQAAGLPPAQDDCWLAVLPFFHVGGLSILYRTALAGCTSHILPGFSLESVLHLVRDGRVTLLSLVPTMLSDLIRHDPDNQLRLTKAIILGGAAADDSLRREIVARRLPVLTSYGMTETASMITLLDFPRQMEKLASAGRTLPYGEIRILDNLGKSVPPGHPGRIRVRGEVLFSKYVGEQKRAADQDGFETGDLGMLDDDGYLTVLGRADRIIVSGGENLDLGRIEAAIRSIPGVSGAVVMPRPDKRWGSRPVAFVEVANASLSESFLLQEIGRYLPRFMIPDKLIVVPHLPLTGSGKHDHSALRQQFPELFRNQE